MFQQPRGGVLKKFLILYKSSPALLSRATLMNADSIDRRGSLLAVSSGPLLA
jgi:hypothetical protein